MPLPETFDVMNSSATCLPRISERRRFTSNATIDANARFTAEMNCRQAIVVAGLDIAAAFFRALDPHVDPGTAG